MSNFLTSFWFPEHNTEEKVKYVDVLRYRNLILCKIFIAQALEQCGYHKRKQLVFESLAFTILSSLIWLLKTATKLEYVVSLLQIF